MDDIGFEAAVAPLSYSSANHSNSYNEKDNNKYSSNGKNSILDAVPYVEPIGYDPSDRSAGMKGMK